MNKFYRLPILLLFLAPSFSVVPTNGAEPLGGNANVEVVALSQQEIDKQIALGKKYEFTVTTESTLIDSTGRTIQFSDFKKYLKKEKCDRRAYFVLSVAVKNLSPERLAPVVSALSDYGVENVVLQRKKSPTDAAQASDSNLPLKGDETVAPWKVKTIVGNPNPHAVTSTDPFPPLDQRPDLLRPQRLPAHVRYVFASDDAVTTAADQISRHLLLDATADGTLFSGQVLVNAGAWLQFRNHKGIGHKDAKPVTARAELNHKILTLEGRLLTNPEEITSLEKVLKKIVHDSGGGCSPRPASF